MLCNALGFRGDARIGVGGGTCQLGKEQGREGTVDNGKFNATFAFKPSRKLGKPRFASGLARRFLGIGRPECEPISEA